ncbi:PLP-dependent aminotransferase family protein [Aliiroseovarius sp. S253]|uniref:MocR-like pyridoxine biosynthesis transcription factor PdxR n=1 Tax=Aliiroseovarius sp. S253 TaxID=3415133 RepID=UPI003C7BF463
MTQLPWLALSIERGSKTPIFEQICTGIRESVVSGDLKEGTKMPPTRVFATEIGVSRSTVITAYEQLVAEGYLTSLRGSGYTVCALGDVELSSGLSRIVALPEQEETRPPIPFATGLPDMRLFPHRQWAKAVARVCRTNPQAMLVGGSSFGNFELRKAIASHLAEWRGIDASAHQIIITAGSMDALEICMQSVIDKGDVIGMENPGYPPLHHFAQAQGLVPTYMNIDDEGAQLPSGRILPDLVVLTPSHQYPLGGAMTPNRRVDFIKWANAHDAWIIEDDYDSEFRYAGRPIPALAGFDQLSRTIYVGSFSKIFSNALRLGYIVVPEGLLERFRNTMARFGQKASYMPQQALAEFMSTGEFYRHLRRVRRSYGERRKYLLERLHREFSQYGFFRDHQAGMQIVFHLDDGVRDKDIARLAQERGIVTRPLTSTYANAEGEGEDGLMLGFCGYSEEELGQALDILKEIFEGLSSA